MAFGAVVVDPAASATDATGLTINWGTAPTVGDLMLVWGGTGASDLSISNTGYTLLLDINNTTESDRMKVWGKIATASEDASVTTTHVSDETALKIQTREGPWAALPGAIDLQEAEARQASGTSTVLAPTGTTAQADELAVAACYTRATNGGTCSWSDSFVEQMDINTAFKSFHAATKVLTSTGTVTTTASYTNDAVSMGGMVTLKKEAAGAAVEGRVQAILNF